MPSDGLRDALSRERGIGNALADKLVERWGDDLASMAEASLDDLQSFQGVGLTRATQIRDRIRTLYSLTKPIAKPSVESPTSDSEGHPLGRPYPLPAIFLPLPDGPVPVRLPAVTIEDDQAVINGSGLSMRIGLGAARTLTGTWNGGLDADGYAEITWDEELHSPDD